MSRLESTARAGYWPSPPAVVERVAALIRPAQRGSRQTTRLLDPCCGTGAALRELADRIGGESYGIEIAACAVLGAPSSSARTPPHALSSRSAIQAPRAFVVQAAA